MRIILILVLGSLWWPISSRVYHNEGMTWPQDPIQTEAYTVLVNKCNSCHAKKKKQTTFTLENMNGRAPEIYQQVFEKKKMPKGRKIKLTAQESLALQKWLDSLSG